MKHPDEEQQRPPSPTPFRLRQTAGYGGQAGGGEAVERGAPSKSAKWELLVVSFLALFLEVMLIRWVPSYERVLAYFTNFVLIAAFLGLGLGAMLTRWRADLMRYQGALLLALVVVAVLFSQHVKTMGTAGDVFYSEFGREAAVTLQLHHCLIFFYLLIAVEFVPLGQRIGHALRTFDPPLQGYILNILGSLLGVIGFALVALLQLSPVWWFGVAGAALCWLVRADPRARVTTAICAVLATLFVGLAGAGYVWSPYHRLVTTGLVLDMPTGSIQPYKEAALSDRTQALPPSLGFHIAVDNDFLQMALDLRPETVNRYPFLRNYQQQYTLPYSIPNFPYHDVLIVGAGTGNDTAAALRAGATHVDAIEIDPALVRLGRQGHPEQPYADPRVRVVVDDARSFFNRTQRKYDLIVFGLLDSHRLFSGMSSVRLDSFVFTVESLREARRLLKPHGLVVLQHGLGLPFMGARMYHMMTEVFAMPPVLLQVPEFPGITYLAGPGVGLYIQSTQRVQAEPVEKATDDWPFFYLAGRQLPREYRVALITMLVLSVLAVFAASGGKMRTVNLYFFFLGAAFLLIEALSITRFAMLFGSTWMINSIVFSAILVVILLANLWMTRLAALDVHLLYAGLGFVLLVNVVFPIHALLRVPLPVRLVAAMVLMGAPIFMAAFIFARSFKTAANPELAFASNLLGAVVGGLIEYFSLVIGFRNLLFVALGLYLLSYLTLLLPLRPKAAPALTAY